MPIKICNYVRSAFFLPFFFTGAGWKHVVIVAMSVASRESLRVHQGSADRRRLFDRPLPHVRAGRAKSFVSSRPFCSGMVSCNELENVALGSVLVMIDRLKRLTKCPIQCLWFILALGE